MSQDAVRGHLDELVLAMLASGPAHGYALIESLRQRGMRNRVEIATA